MCGIIGLISKNEFSVRESLLPMLKRLEYRGYDSAGFATKEGVMYKDIGSVSELHKTLKEDTQTNLAISHTRWATHGGVTHANAHPHFNESRSIFIVHNGIIENYSLIKEKLEHYGYRFITDTDSEAIAHYFDYNLLKGMQMKDIITKFISEVKGTFAILMLLKDYNQLYAIKRDSPLAIGVGKESIVFASDINGFSNITDKAIFLEDDEFCIADGLKLSVYDSSGSRVNPKPSSFKSFCGNYSKGKFKHYMIKEIQEQPESSSRLIESLELIQRSRVQKIAGMIKKAEKVVFVACGTSYHASLIGVYLLNSIMIESHTIIASEINNYLRIDENTLVIALSQSGETMDVVRVLKSAKELGSKICSIVNVPYSTIQRLSDASLELLAGPEVCVASTKVFTNQIIGLLGIAKSLGYPNGLSEIPDKIKMTISQNEAKIKACAKKLYKEKNMFVLGRGISYPIAREIALKLKEISYIHAEGMMAGELKHGTLALIEPGTPVISLIYSNDQEMLSSTREVEARGAKIYTISDSKGDFVVPGCDSLQFSLYATIIGHLLSYHIADELNLPIDKPRNLAKSVTVL